MIITHGIHSRLVSTQAKSIFNRSKARVIVSGKPADNSASILAEINETILARTLHFTNNSSAELSLDVIDRRILRIASANNLQTVEEIATLIGKSLSEAENLEDILQIIFDFTERTEEISVTTSVLEIDPTENIVGLPVAHLSKQFSGDQFKSDFSERVSNVAYDILIELQEAKAWYIVAEGDDGISFGDLAVVSELQQFVESNKKDIQSYLDQLAPTVGSNICTAIGRLAGEGAAIVCMRTKSETAFAVIPANLTGPLLRTWKKQMTLA